MIFIRWYWQYDFPMILTMWFVRWYWQYDFQMMMTIWFVKWCWRYDLSNDVDNMICQTMLTIWFVRWCWQYDLSDDIDNMICLMMLTICASLSEMWFHRQMIFLMTSTMPANITSQLCDAYKIMHNAHCTCDHPVQFAWLLLCLKEADKILAIENQKLKDSQDALHWGRNTSWTGFCFVEIGTIKSFLRNNFGKDFIW